MAKKSKKKEPRPTIVEAHVSIITDLDGNTHIEVRTGYHGDPRELMEADKELAVLKLRSALEKFDPTPPAVEVAEEVAPVEAQDGVA